MPCLYTNIFRERRKRLFFHFFIQRFLNMMHCINIYINQLPFLNTCAIFIPLRGTLIARKLHMCNLHKDGTKRNKRTKGLGGIIMEK